MPIFWDPEVVLRKQVTLREQPGGLELALKNTSSMLRQWELRGYGQWSVLEKASGQVIGCVGLYHPQREWPGVDPVHGEPVHAHTIARPLSAGHGARGVFITADTSAWLRARP